MKLTSKTNTHTLRLCVRFKYICFLLSPFSIVSIAVWITVFARFGRCLNLFLWHPRVVLKAFWLTIASRHNKIRAWIRFQVPTENRPWRVGYLNKYSYILAMNVCAHIKHSPSALDYVDSHDMNPRILITLKLKKCCKYFNLALKHRQAIIFLNGDRRAAEKLVRKTRLPKGFQLK